MSLGKHLLKIIILQKNTSTYFNKKNLLSPSK